MLWSYGMTCVPSRLNTTALKTLRALTAAGFESPRLFVDGPGGIPEPYCHLEVTQHVPRLRTFGNWVTAAWELYIRSPRADRYAIFQDDFVTYQNLRLYLEKSPYPKNSYLNLYVYPSKHNDKERDIGWFEAEQKGLGAVALVFDNRSMRQLLQAMHLVDRPFNAYGTKKEYKSVDGAIVTALNKANIKEYCHNPSLVQHIGMQSSMGNGVHPQAKTFRGETYNALSLVPSIKPPEPRKRKSKPKKTGSKAMSDYDLIYPDPNTPSVASNTLEEETAVETPPTAEKPLETPLEASKPAPKETGTANTRKRRIKIGLLGYSCRSGLGELNRQIATYADIDTWYIKYHGRLQTVNPPPEVDPIFCKGQVDERKLSYFVKSHDVIIFCETTYYRELVPLAKKHGTKLVWIPMQEWAPEDLKGWPQDVHLTLCPTKYCYEQFCDKVYSIHFPWPVDLARFAFKQRHKVEKFLFLNGNGGIKGRKGADVVSAAKKLWPEMPLIVQTQKSLDIPGVEVLKEKDKNHSLYEQGDVLINPAKVDGIGLQRLEALCCGMPVISTDGQPWDESPTIGTIAATKSTMKIARKTDWFEPSPQSLVDVCKELLGKDISMESQEARTWAENHSWEDSAEYFNNLVRSVV